MGQLKRQLATWSAIAVTTAVLPGLALAEVASPDHGGGHGRGHRHDDAKLSVAGRAISKGTTDSYGLQIRGRRHEQPTDASGVVRFAHRGEDVMEGLVGEITCLSKDAAGTVTVTGTVTRSGKRAKGDKGPPDAADETAFLDEVTSAAGSEAGPARHGWRRDWNGPRRGGELAGKDFALTVNVAGRPQQFSQPTIADQGTLAPCTGGGTPTLDVTRGGFRVHEAGDETAGDEVGDEDDRDERRGRRGWWRR